MKIDDPAEDIPSPQGFTAIVEQLLFQRRYREAEQTIDRYQLLHYRDPSYDDVRVERARIWLRESREATLAFDLIAENADYELTQLIASDDVRSINIDKTFPVLECPSGKFAVHSDCSAVSYSHDINEIHENPVLSRQKGFFRLTGQRPADYFFIGRNVRLCVAHDRARTCFDENYAYQRSRSGSLARRTSWNVAKRSKRILDMAYILPFPYRSRNYYHALAEMIYGLRHIHRAPPNVPIVYDEDQFKLLPLFCQAMQVDVSRLVKARDVEDVAFSWAMMPDSPPFYWDANVISFFRVLSERIISRINTKSRSNELIYISRSKASRRPPLEDQLEAALNAYGFQIIHTENMTIREQVVVFSQARKIVAPHGAGLTNAVFSQPGLHLVEIFSPDYIVPDFFHRLKGLGLRYDYVIGDQLGKYIEIIVSKVRN